MIISPLGCGGHIDHRVVTQCFRQAAQSSKSIIPLFYEDLPYAANLALDHIAALVPVAWQGHRFIPVCTGQGHLESKIELLNVYASQIQEAYIIAVRKHWARRGEVLWIPEGYEDTVTCGNSRIHEST